MIDGIRTKEIILPKPDVLDWHQITNRNTGEILPKMFTDLKGLRFINNNGKVYFKGSIHKFSNGGSHNYNDFPFAEQQRAIRRLCNILQVDPADIPLANVEFGLNLKTQMLPDKYLRALIGHKTTSFIGYPPDKHNNSGMNVRHQKYHIKIYSKSNQYGLQENVLRYEIAVKKMNFFSDNNLKLTNIADLSNKKLISDLGDLLKHKSNDLIMVDPWEVNQIKSENERNLLYSWTNPNLFESCFPKAIDFLDKPKAELNKERKRCYADKKNFYNVVNKYGLNTLHNDLMKCIDKEMEIMF